MTDVTLYATDPAQMLTAQHSLIEWCDNKLAAVGQELKEAEYLIERVRHAHLSTKPVERQIATAKRRLLFYEKIKAALQLGYYIIPPLDAQLFAVRTKKEAPDADRSTQASAYDLIAKALPVGTGEYVNPDISRSIVEHRQIGDKKVAVYENNDFKELEFPFGLAKPQIIDATGKALQEKIFDALGCAPRYRAADPMIVGQIKHWKANQGPVHFFIAWWLDTNSL